MTDLARTCSDEHSRFCSPCDTAKRYNSLHCGGCSVPVAPRVTATPEDAVVRLAEVSRALARAAGMAMAVGCSRELIELLNDAGSTLDDVINDLDGVTWI